MTSAFETEQKAPRYLIPSVEFNKEINDSEKSTNDRISVSEHNTNSEQEDNSEITEEKLHSNAQFFIGKGGTKRKERIYQLKVITQEPLSFLLI